MVREKGLSEVKVHLQPTHCHSTARMEREGREEE